MFLKKNNANLPFRVMVVLAKGNMRRHGVSKVGIRLALLDDWQPTFQIESINASISGQPRCRPQKSTNNAR